MIRIGWDCFAIVTEMASHRGLRFTGARIADCQTFHNPFVIHMKTSRRHNSLIPLSHDHHHALVLCLRIHQGLKKKCDDGGWLKLMTEETIRFYESDLTSHFKIEEEVLFPAMRNVSEATELIEELLSEHRALENFIGRLRQMNAQGIEETLTQLADCLKAHIRKEENSLFPIYEKSIPEELADTIGQKIKVRQK
jgi:iron-sulfur cluster repair protein YtfE (RIC family)